ncbi:hypothetical protein [Steroidobacter cummioxidans]|uniref:hypothetical protein n=1 Tax=Steroidobacter cummioxidans TaxID=1803913 RepID=UPI0012903265|nr:hypothetical protein [Steroidobacter cummioxidans]
MTRSPSFLIELLRLSALCLAAQLLSGCVSQTAVLNGYTKPATVAPFEIADARPAEERESKIMSLLITSCNYGVHQVGDKRMVPDRLTLLGEDLNAAMGAQLAGKSLVLNRYAVHFNNAQALRNGVAKMNPGLIVDMLKGVGARCPRDEMKAGWFEPDDVTTPYSPFIVEVTLTVDGKAHSVRSVYSPDKEVSQTMGDPESTVALFAAIRKANEKLIASLRET